MIENDKPYTFDRVIRLLLTAGILIGLFVLLRYLSDVLVPFAAAVIIAYLLNPLVTRIEKRTKRRGLAVLATLAGLSVLGLALLALVIPLMGGQLRRFDQSIRHLRADLPDAPEVESVPATSALVATTQPAIEGTSSLGLEELWEAWGEYRRTKGQAPRSERLETLYGRLDGTQVGALTEEAAAFVKTQEFRALVIDAARRVAVGGLTVVNFAVEFVLGLTVLVVVGIYLVFLLLDFNEYARTAKGLLPPSVRDGVLAFIDEFEVAMRRYFRGQSFVAISVGVLFSIGFSIIGLPMAVPLGLFVGLLNMVPYLQIVALVPAGLLAVLGSIETSGSLVGSLGLVLLVFAVVQVLQDAIIVPRIMGKATGLRPVAILLGVFVWGKLLGFFGLLLAIPLTCLGIAYYRRHILTSPLAAAPPRIERA